jgi:hypothetical protein
MSIKVMEWVWNNSRARDGQLLVLLAIADCAHEDGGGAFPSNAELRRKSRLSERAVQYAIAGLEASGELTVGRQQGPKGCNLYRVVMTPAKSAPPQNLHPRNLRHQGVQSATENVSQIAPVTVKEPSVEPSVRTSEVADAPADPPRPDVEDLCNHLADAIAANGSKRPAVTKTWRDACRLMLDKDERTAEHVRAAIDWCQNDEFWRGNILSMPKLRTKYDQMRLQATRGGRTTRPDDVAARQQRALHRAAEREAQMNPQTQLELTP